MKKIFLFLVISGMFTVAFSQTTTFNSGFNAPDAANFDILTSPATQVVFGFDWQAPANITNSPTSFSGISTDPSTGYTTLPSSPNGDHTGLWVTVNNNTTGQASAFVEGVSIYPKVAPSAPNYDVQCDMLIAYTTPLGVGGSGSTEYIGMVVQSSGTTLNSLRDNALSGIQGANNASAITTADGVSFGFSGDEGDARSGFFCYQPSTRTTAPGTSTQNGQVGTWTSPLNPLPVSSANSTGKKLILNIPPVDSTYFGAYNGLYPVGRDSTQTFHPGWVWSTVKAQVRGGFISFYVNGFKFCDVFSSDTHKRVGILAADPFASWSNPPCLSYMLFDNFKIVEYPTTVDVDKRNWMLFDQY